MLYIGICGRARNGKDLVAAVMADTMGSPTGTGIYRKVFVTSVSNEVMAEATKSGLIRTPIKRNDLTKQEIINLMTLGHTARQHDENFWINRVAQSIARVNPDVVIITGIRFLNEWNWIRAHRGVMVRVKRLNEDGTQFISNDRDPNDPMETSSDHIHPDYELVAKTGQEAWLRVQATSLAQELIGSHKEGQ